MSAFLRIRGRQSIAAEPTSSANSGDPDEYLDKLIKMIPAEVIGLYLVGSGLIPASHTRPWLAGWTVLCLCAVVVVRAKNTADAANGKGAQRGAVAISAVAFVIWVYSMGGPFKEYMGNAYQAFVGSLLVLAWTFVVPFFYTPRD